MYSYKKNLVSIIIPCYNGEAYIDRCMNALLNQTHRDIEVIVIDDGSTDNSKELLSFYIDKFQNNGMKLTVLSQKNSGQAAALNKGLKEATGEFLMWQDIDDFYVPDAVENLKAYLDNHQDVGFVRGEAAFYMEKNLNEPIRIGRSNNPQNRNILDAYIFQRDSYSFVGIWMAKFDYFDKCVNGRNIYISKGGQNWQLILPMAYYGGCGYLNKVVYNQLETTNSHSRVKYKTIDEAIEREEVLQDILKNVLGYLGIYDNYKTLLDEKYCRNKFIVSFKYNDKSAFEKYMKELKSYRRLSLKEKIIALSMNNQIIRDIIFKIKKV